MTEFRMPSLGSDMEAGTLVEWKKQPGETVARGDIIAVVETQKGAIEVEVFEPGTVERLLVDPGAKVPVGTPMAFIRAPGEAALSEAAPAAAESLRPASRPAPPAEPIIAVPALATVVPASPAARRLAAERGIELNALHGTGPHGAVRLCDVEAVLSQAVPAPASAPVREAQPAPERGVAMRQAIAAAMARSKREIPHYYLGHTIDMGRTMAWLAEENASRPVPRRLIASVVLIKAVARALREVPEFNGFWLDGAFRPGDAINVGVAISLRGGGLVAPAIHDADAKSLDELMAGLRDLVARARAFSLRSSEMSDPTITVTSLGEQGVESVLGVIYPPQVALVGFGRIAERPWSVNGGIGLKPLMAASLSADHRASDGHRGGLLLAAVDRLLQRPETL